LKNLKNNPLFQTIDLESEEFKKESIPIKLFSKDELIGKNKLEIEPIFSNFEQSNLKTFKLYKNIEQDNTNNIALGELPPLILPILVPTETN
jgi:hypothetical protein